MANQRDLTLCDESQRTAATKPVFSGRKLVVVVGIDEYKTLPGLRCAVSDAIGVQELLVNRFAFEAPIAPLINDAATKPAIEALIEDRLPALLGRNDALVLFFAGHGTTRVTQLDEMTVETGYVAPVEARGLGAFSDLVCMEELLRNVAVLPARHIMVLLDACHSGMALGNAVSRYRSVSSFVHRLARRRSRRVITSARRDELALDNGPIPGHSLFTGTLIAALSSGRADLDRNGIVTFSELALFLQQQVGQASGARQTPDHGAFHLDDRGELMLAVPHGAYDHSGAFQIGPAHSIADLQSATAHRIRGARAAALGAIVAAAATIAVVVALAVARPAPQLDTEGVKLVERRTTLDLRGWKNASEDDIASKRKVSKAVSVNEFTVERLHDGGQKFLHRMGTSSPIDPEVDCGGCEVRQFSKDIAPTPREWNIIFYIRNEPIGHPIPIRFSVTFWNAFQNADQWWGGFRIIHPTKRATFKVLFPTNHRPLATDISFAFVKAGTAKREPVVPAPEDWSAVVGNDGRVDEVEWAIDHPEDDLSYRVYWNWPELLQPHDLRRKLAL